MTEASIGANPAPGFARHPEHAITVEPVHGRVRVYADQTPIADSRAALLLYETNHAPTYYIPLEDIDGDCLRRSAYVTRCPFKGKASHWNVVVGEHEIDNAVRSYEMPYDEMLELAGMAAFYPSKVTIEVETG